MSDSEPRYPSDAFGGLIPLLRDESRRLLWRQAQDRWQMVKALTGGGDVDLDPVWPGGDKANAERYLDLPVPRAFTRVHRLSDGTSESLSLPNLGAVEIERELELYVQLRTIPEDLSPAVRTSSDYETWMTAVSSREREQGKIFGSLPRFALIDPAHEEHAWFGGFIVIASKAPSTHVTILTSGLADPELSGERTRHTRDYELYVQCPSGCERWAINLLHWMVQKVIQCGEDHLATLRSTRHIVLESMSVPGLEQPAAFLVGVRGTLPRALPIAGGASKLIPVTLIHDVELQHALKHGPEELAAMLIEEGPGVFSDPTRQPVIKAGKRGWKFW